MAACAPGQHPDAAHRMLAAAGMMPRRMTVAPPLAVAERMQKAERRA